MNKQDKINLFNNMQISFSSLTYDDRWFTKVFNILKNMSYIDQSNILIICQFVDNCIAKYGKCIHFEKLTELEQLQILELL